MNHQRNSQLKPGYNVQICVESEYVTGVEIFQDRNDIATVIPILEAMNENFIQKYTSVIADSGYRTLLCASSLHAISDTNLRSATPGGK